MQNGILSIFLRVTPAEQYNLTKKIILGKIILLPLESYIPNLQNQMFSFNIFNVLLRKT